MYLIFSNGRHACGSLFKTASGKAERIACTLPDGTVLNSIVGVDARRRDAFGVQRSLSHSGSIKRAVRRTELRRIVPLSDTTIYELEQRGEFPRRFYLTPRCVAWDLAEVEEWIAARQRASNQSRLERVPRPDVGQRKTRPVRRKSPTRSTASTETGSPGT
jgi:prophage regulatory protein